MFSHKQDAAEPANADACTRQQRGDTIFPMQFSCSTNQVSVCQCMSVFLKNRISLVKEYQSSICVHYRYPLDQQMMAPPFPVQQVNCNAVLVPSPVFTSPIMIPHNSFITHQATPTYTPHPSAAPQSIPLQQPQQFFQVNKP